MVIWSIGINHTTAQVEMRSRFAYAPEEIEPALHDLQRCLGTAAAPVEAAILSTCNRTELYCASNGADVDACVEWFADNRKAPAALLRSHGYVLQDTLAVGHAFRVASGLDSMVLGEAQILGQMKKAVSNAQQANTLGTTLSQLFQRSFAVAKDVRSATDIGSHSVSMAAVAVQLAARQFGDLGQLSVLFIGAGKMAELVVTHFAGKGVGRIAVANRTHARGEALAARVGGDAVPWADLPQRLAEFDVVISSTGSQQPVVWKDTVEAAIARRAGRAMLMIDLAVPCDIDPAVADVAGVRLCTLDDLEHLVQAGKAHRQRAVADAEAIIGQAVEGFQRWLSQRRALPLIHRLHEQAEAWKTAELHRARRRLAKGEDMEVVLENLSRGLAQKMLHGALSQLNHGDQASQARAWSAIELLFLDKPGAGHEAGLAPGAGAH
jgi:glutamyl-tRNA reductase